MLIPFLLNLSPYPTLYTQKHMDFILTKACTTFPLDLFPHQPYGISYKVTAPAKEQ